MSGNFGPPYPANSNKPTTKSWPPLNPNKKESNRICNEIKHFNPQQNLHYWLYRCKQYDAEWQEELDEYNEWLGHHIEWLILKHQINQAFSESK